MEIRSYHPDMAPELASAYNRLIETVPHCYPITPETFASAAAVAVESGSSHEVLHSEAAFVATDGDAIRGFAHTALGRKGGGDDDDEHGFIRFLWYEPGQRHAGQALLAHCEQHLRERGMADVIAFWQSHHRYPFYHLDAAFLSDRLSHVVALVGLAGYERIAGEVFYDWPNYQPPDPPPPTVDVDVRVEWEQGGGARPAVCLRAYQGEDEVGECRCESCGEYADVPEAQDCFLISWLGVAERVRGKGLGRALLARALHEMRGAGYPHATISTAWWNHRAQLFYSNFGYRVVDWTYGFGRQLA